MVTIPFYRTFRCKLVTLYILLIASVVAISGILSYQAAEKQFRQLLFQEFHATRNVAKNFITFVEQTALIAARAAAADRELQETLLVDNSEGIGLRLAALMKQNSSDLIILLDHEGRVIARGHEPESFGDSLLAFDFVADLRRGGKKTVSAIVQDQDSLILYSTAVFRHPATAAPVYVLAGYALNNSFVDNIQENSHIEVSLVRERSIISTTLHSNGKRIITLPISFLEYEILLANQGQVLEVRFLGQDYFLSAERLPLMQENMAGSMLLSHSQEELTAVKNQLLLRFFAIFTASIVAGVALIVFCTGRMLQPIEQLIQSTKQISSGDLQSRIRLDVKDEFSLLGEHFNIMAAAVQERDAALTQYSLDLEHQVEERTRKIVEQSVLINNVLQSSKDLAIVVVDTELRVKYFNPVAETIFGRKAADVLGRSVPEIHDEENVEHSSFEKGIAVVKAEGVYNFSCKRQREGTVRYIESSVTAIVDTDGVRKGFVLMSVDVTQRREMEKRVVESKKFEGFSVLAGGLAHDFNNLLQVIVGGVSYARSLIAKESDLDPVLSDVELASEQATQLSNAMLTLSKGSYLSRSACDLKHFLEQEAEQAQSDTICCETRLADDLWLIDGNKDLLQDAIHNVFDNALAAMAGEGTLTVSARNLPAGDGSELPLVDCNRIEIVVSDTGTGISAQHMTRIFDPYFSTKERGSQKGMGLGLATTMAIIKKHDGRITVQSEEGKGTSVAVYLPARV